MAEENEPAEGEESGQNPGGKKKLILLIVLGLVLIGASVGGTLFAIGMMKEDEVVANDANVEATPEPQKQAIYYPIKPHIIVNFDTKGRKRYLQAEITFLVREPDVVAAIELHMPMIRNALVMLIGGQVYSEIQTAEGKEFLRLECLQEIQTILEKEIGKPGVEQVLFTNLVMQ